MLTTETKVRVRYAETDQMGYVYYGRFADYYEVGRTEMIRNLNLSYKQFEDMGIMMPVLEMKIRYFKAARYDDLLTIKTSLEKLPIARIRFVCVIQNEAGEKLNEGEVTLVFTDSNTRKPTRAPDILLKALQPFF
jgi:acyl-CoA thioester hydrolase